MNRDDADSDDEQNTSDEMEFINRVLDSMADQNLDVLSIEEIEELILEMERAADEKAVHGNPAPDCLSFYERSALTKLRPPEGGLHGCADRRRYFELQNPSDIPRR